MTDPPVLEPMAAARAALADRIGQQIHVSDWLAITQARIDRFADATDDHQWIHTDAERAVRESPWRTTIAHGYLTLSLYPTLRGLVDGALPVPGLRTVVNYGLNRLRFVNAVRVGVRVRARIRLLAIEDFAGGLQLVEEFTVDIEGESRPACVAEVVMRWYF